MKRLSERRQRLCGLETEIDKHHEIRPYLEWWAEAFDSGGVRSFVMKELVSTLNNEASRYLSHLLGSRVGIRFLEGLEPSLYRIDSGTPVSYAQCSGGQKRRVKIASALAFLDVMRSASGCDLDVFVLDEIENSLDEAGLLGMRDALREVSLERKVLVITQSRFFAESLAEDGAGQIRVEYKDARSNIA
jgi:DNA repair exonuclease SbcCD ATPase subunit